MSFFLIVLFIFGFYYLLKFISFYVRLKDILARKQKIENKIQRIHDRRRKAWQAKYNEGVKERRAYLALNKEED